MFQISSHIVYVPGLTVVLIETVMPRSVRLIFELAPATGPPLPRSLTGTVEIVGGPACAAPPKPSTINTNNPPTSRKKSFLEFIILFPMLFDLLEPFWLRMIRYDWFGTQGLAQ
jgi:hypothetical protein